MRSPNKNRHNGDGADFSGTIAVFIVAIIGILTVQALRALLKPNTRDYRPLAYDVPHSRNLVADLVSSLGTARLAYGSVALLTLVIGALLFSQALTGTVIGRQLLSRL